MNFFVDQSGGVGKRSVINQVRIRWVVDCGARTAMAFAMAACIAPYRPYEDYALPNHKGDKSIDHEEWFFAGPRSGIL